MKYVKYISAFLLVLFMAFMGTFHKEVSTFFDLQDWKDNKEVICQNYESKYRCFMNGYSLKFNEKMYPSEGVLVTAVGAMLLFEDKEKNAFGSRKIENIIYTTYYLCELTFFVHKKLLENQELGFIDKIILKRFSVQSSQKITKMLDNLKNKSDLENNVKNSEDRAAILKLIEDYEKFLTENGLPKA